jgi:hypothetical protein
VLQDHGLLDLISSGLYSYLFCPINEQKEAIISKVNALMHKLKPNNMRGQLRLLTELGI